MILDLSHSLFSRYSDVLGENIFIYLFIFYILSIVLRLSPLVYFDIKNFFSNEMLFLWSPSNWSSKPFSKLPQLIGDFTVESHLWLFTQGPPYTWKDPLLWAGLCSFPAESTWAAQGEAGERHHAHPSRSAHNYNSNSFWFFLPEPNPK